MWGWCTIEAWQNGSSGSWMRGCAISKNSAEPPHQPGSVQATLPARREVVARPLAQICSPSPRIGSAAPQAGLTPQPPNCTVQVEETKSFIMLRNEKRETMVVSALRARANFGQLLRRVEDERSSVVIEKRGTAKAVLIGIRDYVRLAAPEPEVLRVIGEESQRKGTDKLSSQQIDRVIKAARARKPKRA
ncbi:MAG: type II toxin-antitoxin system Phd/YefM family antitoxin [Bryobacteraceae bacterium]